MISETMAGVQTLSRIGFILHWHFNVSFSMAIAEFSRPSTLPLGLGIRNLILCFRYRRECDVLTNRFLLLPNSSCCSEWLLCFFYYLIYNFHFSYFLESIITSFNKLF